MIPAQIQENGACVFQVEEIQTLQPPKAAARVASSGRAGAVASMQYSAPLDGVRAVAILAVLGFHVFPTALRGGFTGVDVFFVLSGYLITSVILYDIRCGKFSMREFYLRRIQRLLPNAVLMILVTVAASLLLLPSNTAKVAAHGIWALFNLSNVYILRHIGGYWGTSAPSAPLLHTWSLAVEEQFYLAFPLTLALLARRSKLFGVTAGLALGSLALGVYGTWTHPNMTFYLLPTRAWEPLLGAALATYLVPAAAEAPVRQAGSSPANQLAGWIGLAMIVGGFFFIAEADHFPGVVALAPALGSLLLLISIADGKTGPARLLSQPFFVTIGKLSYSLYLWHWPAIVMGRMYADLTGRSDRAGTLIGLLVGVILALLAYRFVEHPLRQRGAGRSRRLLVLASGFALCIALCLTTSLRRPVADPLHMFDQPSFYGLLYNSGAGDAIPLTTTTRYYDVRIPERPPQQRIWKTGGIVHAWGHSTPRLVVLGSSHALMYGRLIDDICKERGISVAFLVADATQVFFPTKVGERFPTPALAQDFDAARRKWIAEWKPDAVLVVDRWDSYEPEELRQKLHGLVSELLEQSPSVILASQVPALRLGTRVNLREYVTWYFKRFGRLPAIAPDEKEPIRKSSIATFEALAREFSGVRLVRPDPWFYSEDGSVRYASGRSFLYADGNHLDDAGAEALRGLWTSAIMATQRTEVAARR